jgi:hypothetical protein
MRLAMQRTTGLRMRPAEYVAVCVPPAAGAGNTVLEGSIGVGPALSRVVSYYEAEGWTLVNTRPVRSSTQLLFRRPLRRAVAAPARARRQAGAPREPVGRS